jgi:hypothetical protein
MVSSQLDSAGVRLAATPGGRCRPAGTDQKSCFMQSIGGLTSGGHLSIWPPTGGAHGHRVSDHRQKAEKFSKTAIDGWKSPPYMAVHRRGRAIWHVSFASHQSVIPVPRIKTGRVRRRLFDIVGLDEGTCGRRLRSPRVLRPRTIGQIMPFLYVLLHIHSNMYLCRNGSLKPALDVCVFPQAPMVGH